MLSHILIRDLAIVTSAEISFDQGLTALTGETGAGKSILIDALGLALGDKADPILIRTGCDRAEVVATFDLAACPEAESWLAEQALDDEGLCILRRVLARQGRSRAFINGRAVTSAQLTELGERLVDIHGQHAHQSLLRPAAQRSLLDSYGNLQTLSEEVAQAYRRFRALDEQVHQLRAADADRTDRLEQLRDQVDELAALGLTSAEIDELDREQRRLSHLGRLQDTTARLLRRLSEDEPALHDELRQATAELTDLRDLDPRLGATCELIDGAAIQIGEAASSLRHYVDSLDIDPSVLRDVETKLGLVHDLARKYRVFPIQLPDTLAERRAALAELEAGAVQLETIAAQCAQARDEFIEQASILSQARSVAASQLAATVTEAMQQLGMAGGQLAVTVTGLDLDAAGIFGLDRVAFLVSANPGQALQPLAKVASGGELSRISLAIQVATAECGRIPTLVFDEVDVGIGGRVAAIVGHLLRRLGTNRQVLCVTHLPQVAAQAHRHLVVRKHTEDGETFTEIRGLDDEARVEEIARMLGGKAITSKTRAHAREMLETAG